MYNLVLIDLRGHGKSVKLKNYEDYTIPSISKDIYDVVEKLQLSDFFLVSHSFGTLIALEFLATHQRLAQGVIFLSPSAHIADRFLVRISKPFPWLGYIFPISKKTGSHVDYCHYKNTGDWNIRRLFRDIWNTSIPIYLFCIKQSYNFNKENFLEKINLPTLLIHGKEDSIFPVENSILMHEKIKNSELLLIPKSDHIIVLNNYEEILAAIITFVEKYTD